MYFIFIVKSIRRWYSDPHFYFRSLVKNAESWVLASTYSRLPKLELWRVSQLSEPQVWPLLLVLPCWPLTTAHCKFWWISVRFHITVLYMEFSICTANISAVKITVFRRVLFPTVIPLYYLHLITAPSTVEKCKHRFTVVYYKIYTFTW